MSSQMETGSLRRFGRGVAPNVGHRFDSRVLQHVMMSWHILGGSGRLSMLLLVMLLLLLLLLLLLDHVLSMCPKLCGSCRRRVVTPVIRHGVRVIGTGHRLTRVVHTGDSRRTVHRRIATRNAGKLGVQSCRSSSRGAPTTVGIPVVGVFGGHEVVTMSVIGLDVSSTTQPHPSSRESVTTGSSSSRVVVVKLTAHRRR